jgi:hypothetical protein
MATHQGGVLTKLDGNDMNSIAKPVSISYQERRIWAAFDTSGLWVYQAFHPTIANEALAKGTFGDSFSLKRMTWIKPSFGWILHRSYYATRTNQACILKIKVSQEGFLALLSQAVPSSWDRVLFKSEADWRDAVTHSEVRYQWDPDRDIRLRRLTRRALQVGLRGRVVQEYVASWILEIEDVTRLAQAIHAAIESGLEALPAVPEERVYEVSSELQRILGMR